MNRKMKRKPKESYNSSQGETGNTDISIVTLENFLKRCY